MEELDGDDDRLGQRRNLIGMSAALWSRHGEHEVLRGCWKALSGAPSVDYNLLVCHSSDPDAVKRSVDAVAAAHCQAEIVLAGPGLANAQILSDAGWVCIGTAPIMVLEGIGARTFVSDPEVSIAGPEDLPGVWDKMGQTFGVDSSLARVAIPEDVFDTQGQNVWKLSVEREIRACVATVVVGKSVMIWSMATLPQWQHRGYGRRLLTTALMQSAGQGVTESILYASPAGEPLYRSLGYQTTEYWQMWSRPRWVLGRT
ncbi:MAG TPA: GNAT family N-acetyltransferase [Acidimicrobiales bacterium]